MWGFGRCHTQKYFMMQIRASEQWCCRIFEHFSEVHNIYPKLENIPVQNILFPIAEQALTSYLHNGSTLEHDLNRLWKLQFRATTFVFDLFLEFGHMTTLPITYWLDPDRYNHHYLLFPHFWVKNYQYFPFWNLPWTLNASPNNTDHHSYFISDFSPILCLFFI